MATTAQQIANVEAAIARAEDAQAYSVDGRSKTNPSLKTLYERLDYLLLKQARESDDTGGLDLARFQEPR